MSLRVKLPIDHTEGGSAAERALLAKYKQWDSKLKDVSGHSYFRPQGHKACLYDANEAETGFTTVLCCLNPNLYHHCFEGDAFAECNT